MHPSRPAMSRGKAKLDHGMKENKLKWPNGRKLVAKEVVVVVVCCRLFRVSKCGGVSKVQMLETVSFSQKLQLYFLCDFGYAGTLC